MAPAAQLRVAVALVGRFPVLAGASLLVEQGEIVHLQGENGAGKTSLLRVLAGLIPLSSGEGEVLGHDLVRDPRAARRELFLLGHRGALYDDLSVEENLGFALRASGGDPARIAPSLRRVGLTGRLVAARAGGLSQGQRRRVGLAIGLARSCRLWLLDEPHAGIDEEGRALVDELVAEVASVSSTVIFSSHELERASRIADRSLVVAGGYVLEGPGPVTRRGGEDVA